MSEDCTACCSHNGETIECDGILGHNAVMHWHVDRDTGEWTRWRSQAEIESLMEWHAQTW